MSNSLVNAIVEMKDGEALKLVEEMLAKGADVNEILSSCQEAMGIVGQRFEKQVYFLPELIMGGEILKSITRMVKPKMQEVSAEDKNRGKIVFGTVAGDIHDIGKDIVIFMLEVNGFEVIDLGVDVPIEKFVEKIKEVNPDIVGLSGFLTITFDTMKETVAAIAGAGYRDKVKIMVGGGTVTEDIKDYAGADGYGENAMDAVILAQKWMGVE
ncbi:cobalamin B12-binding domain-containing protein [Candidatus Formimonas warabiya]|uniref:Methionine synthase n=1 Tax=Formimonas warabiya TaxID=1761012 RepID=A0A3G1KXS6_FORW1|nr:cobalamin-dependent protein [Candidatus Formimonas warabiya]ATW27284.1 methionine synthase [Candidatus Formimonas warabiya]